MLFRSVIPPRESISRSHVSSRGDFPDKIKVLKKKGPASLLSREFVRVFEIGQVLMISEDRDRVRSPLQVLFPLSKSEDNSKELPIIDVVVALGQREGLGKVSAGVKVSRCIRLHQDCTGSEKGGVGHEGKGVRDIRDT